MSRRCPGCGCSLAGRRPQAKFCSPTCRKRGERKRLRAVETVTPANPSRDTRESHPTVAATSPQAQIEPYAPQVGDRVRLERAEGTVERMRESVPPGYLLAEVTWDSGARSPVPARWLVPAAAASMRVDQVVLS
jgi:hypothetical protein